MFVVSVDDMVLLEWLKVKCLLAKAFPEFLIGVVKVQEFLLDYLDVVWVFKVYLHVVVIVFHLLLKLLVLVLALRRVLVLIVFIIFVVDDVRETCDTSSFFVSYYY